MIVLKDYQSRVLDSVRTFFRACSRLGRPDRAFEEVQLSNGSQPAPYLPVAAAGLAPDMPYVCLRLPTGGGKTLLACHATGIAMAEFLQADHCLVLWLVPSNTLLQQTVEALRDPAHAYRRALELTCGEVEVLTIEEALSLSRGAADAGTVVIVATIQSFRVEDTAGRKVYDQNGALAEHFLNVPLNRVGDLLAGPDGKPKPSLVNVLRLRRPIVIVDEAHNARTDLSFATLGSVLPSCIVEFTATPARRQNPSNVLHRVSAAELKAAEMIKLPLRVVTRHPGQREQLLAEAVALRSDLEKMAAVEAQETGEYLRPILLVQAERVDACETLRDQLVSQHGLAKNSVVISVGRLDELRSIRDVAAPDCPVRVIITVEKLREGWDCPSAYVLCSLKETRSATAIEQIVGRILRMPDAHAKRHAELNCSYVFSVSQSIAEVLSELRDALQQNGFTAAEAERIVLPVPQGVLPLGVRPGTVQLAPEEIDRDVAQVQSLALGGRARIDAATGQVTVIVPLAREEAEALTSCFRTPDARARVSEAIEFVRAAERAFGGSGDPRLPSGHEQNLDFSVPILCIEEDGRLLEFESTFLLEHSWKLSDKDASLSEGFNPLERPVGKAGLVDVGVRGEVLASEQPGADFVSSLHQHVLALGVPSEWTLEGLVSWLDRHIPHGDIPVGESAAFLRKAVRGIMAKYAIDDVGKLALDRYRLRDEVESRIDQHRTAERKAAFQMFLLPESALVVRDEFAINFRMITYEPGWVYDGGFQFKKHYFGPRPGELRESEEFRCAQFIDALPDVQFWVRNLPRRATSFRLQTSKDWFYPDFVCQLRDGRVLVVEYKGAHLFAAPDAEEKRAVGEVWASRSGGRCLFVMPTREDFSPIATAVSR